MEERHRRPGSRPDIIPRNETPGPFPIPKRYREETIGEYEKSLGETIRDEQRHIRSRLETVEALADTHEDYLGNTKKVELEKTKRAKVWGERGWKLFATVMSSLLIMALAAMGALIASRVTCTSSSSPLSKHSTPGSP